MTSSVNVGPTLSATELTHHVSLEDAANNKIGLILYPNERAINRRPKQSSQYNPFTQVDWSGGRGIKEAATDKSRYADSKRLSTRRMGDVMLAGLETFSTGHRQVEQFMPSEASGLTWQALTGTSRFAAFKVTASASGNRKRIYFWVRRRGTPHAALDVRLKSDTTGDPDAQLKLVSASTTDIDDTISLLYEFTFSSVQAVVSGTAYWVEASTSSSADDATNHWEVGIDATRTKAKTKISADGTALSWSNATFDLYYRLVDDASFSGAIKFTHKGQLYKITRGTSPKLYMSGWRGVATGAGQSVTALQDTTQAFTASDLIGKTILFVDGPGSELPRPYTTISGNTTDTVSFPALGTAPVAGQTVYVILDTTKWNEITGHGLTAVTDVADAGGVLYFAQGDAVNMRRMHEFNLAGVWTREFSDEDNRAKFIKAWRHPTSGVVLMKANDYDNSNRPSVALAKARPWGTRLSFPWLLDDCEATTNWTASAGVTLTADASIYIAGSKSIKMQITGAPTLMGYRTWSGGINLKDQKSIRFWVYVDTAVDAGVIKLRLSALTNCSTSIQQIDLPELEASKWTQVILPFKDHNVPSIVAVKSIGFTKNGTFTAFYVDGIETLPGDSEVQLGNDLERITGIEVYGDPAVPWVFRTKSVGSIENGAFVPIPLREYEQVENIHNGQGHVVYDVYLFFSFLQGIEQYYRQNLDDIGPNRDEGLPSSRQGYAVSMIGYPGRIFVAYDAGPNGYSSIFEYKGNGYHEIYRCDAKGKSIGDLFVQVIPGESADRLWFSEGPDTVSLPLPGNTGNEATDSTYLFTHEGVLETGWFSNDELEQLVSGVKLTLDSMDADTKIEWDYKVDADTGSWVPISTNFTTQPAQKISLNIATTRLKLRFRFQSAKNAKTPHLRRMTVRITVRPETRYTYSMNFMFSDNAVDLLGQADAYTRAETLITQLDAWADANTPLTMKCAWSPMDNKTVYLDPVVLSPLLNMPENQQEKQSGTLIAIEPE